MTLPSWHTPRRTVAGVVVLGVVLRAVAMVRAGIIESDGAYYAGLAGALLRGDFAHGLSTVWPPLYPALIAAFAAVPHAFGAALTPELLENAARCVSLAAGVALWIPLTRLARRVGGDDAARVTLAFAAVHPRLVQFSAAALTESLFTTLIVTGTLAWMSRQRVVAGLALGLATLARPEGVALAGLFAAGAILERNGRRARGLLAFLLPLALVLLPYVAFVHARTGAISLGEKGEYNFWRAYRSEYARVLPEPATLSERVSDSPELADRLPPSRPDVAGFIARAPGIVAIRTLRNLIRLTFGSLPNAITPAFLVFAVAGVGAVPLRTAWPVAAPVAFALLLYAPFSADRRFLVPWIPFVLLFASIGVRRIGAWGARGAPGRAARNSGVLIAATVCLYSIYALVFTHSIDSAPEHRAAGLRLRAYADSLGTDEALVVMSRKPWVAYYAAALHAELPDAPLTGIESRIRSTGTRVLVVDDRWALPQRPVLAALRDPALAPPGYAPLFRIAAPPPIILYDVHEATRSGEREARP